MHLIPNNILHPISVLHPRRLEDLGIRVTPHCMSHDRHHLGYRLQARTRTLSHAIPQVYPRMRAFVPPQQVHLDLARPVLLAKCLRSPHPRLVTTRWLNAVIRGTVKQRLSWCSKVRFRGFIFHGKFQISSVGLSPNPFVTIYRRECRNATVNTVGPVYAGYPTEAEATAAYRRAIAAQLLKVLPVVVLDVYVEGD